MRWPRSRGYLNVSELSGGGDAVDGHVGRAEGRPQVVGVGAQPLRGFVGFSEEGLRRRPVLRSGGRHGTGEEESAVDREVFVVRGAQAGLHHGRRIVHQLDRRGEATGGQQAVCDRPEKRARHRALAAVLRGRQAAVGGDPLSVKV